MNETTFAHLTKRGDTGPAVRRIQEWLGLNHHSVVLDGDFGPGTELALKTFQTKVNLPADGIASEPVWQALVAPMTRALKPIPKANHSLTSLVDAYAHQHLAGHPIEVGGENSGPWVRLYMNGNEGKAWPWCAGFCTFVLKQASAAAGVIPPLPQVFGCDDLAGRAQAQGLYLRPKTPADFAKIRPGAFFLVRKGEWHWQHIGIVTGIQDDAILTIEGNTNDSGSPEGFEVCARTRAIKDKDFILF